MIGRVFPTLLHGLEQLSDARGCMPFEGRVAHSCIRILQCLLDRMCFLSVTRAEERADQYDNGTSNTQSRKKMSKCRTCKERSLKCDQRTPTCRNCQRNGLHCDRAIGSSSSARQPSISQPVGLSRNMLKLCELTASFVNCLDATKAMHKIILEGFLFVFLDKIGKGLKQFVFESHDVKECGREDPSNGSAPFASQVNCQEDATFKAQAPYLIWLLERIQPLASPPPPNLEPPHPVHPNNSIATFARDQLQYTLLKAVFGDDAPANYEPAIKPLPALADVQGQESASADVDVKDWYTHEVWRLLGWDVLRSHGTRDL